MEKKLCKHTDCRNFAPVDVAKGMCRVKNELVFVDSDVCDNFETLPKCKNCAMFSSDKENMGACNGFKDSYWTFDDNIAVTCEGYKEK